MGGQGVREKAKRFDVALRNSEEDVEDLRQRVALEVQGDGQTFAELIRAIAKGMKKSGNGDRAVASTA